MFSNFPGQFVPFFTKCGDQGKEVEDVIYIVISGPPPSDGLLHP